MLAVLIGVALVVVLQLLLPTIVGAYGPSAPVREAALAYLRVAVCGLPAVLVLLAGTGVLRGLQDTTTPLKVAVATNLANIALNATLVYGVGLGIRGSAIGTLIAQTGAAAVIAVIVVRGARRSDVPLGFHPAGVFAAARTGVWLIARTATLQVAITLTTVVAAAGGTIVLAAYQVVNSIWVLLAFALDAIAIAGQAIIGRLLGAGDVATGRAMTTRMIGWGVVCGVVFGARRRGRRAVRGGDLHPRSAGAAAGRAGARGGGDHHPDRRHRLRAGRRADRCRRRSLPGAGRTDLPGWRTCRWP